jgi:S1-C subfamily serine protease
MNNNQSMTGDIIAQLVGSNVLMRTFFIQTRAGYGTGFTLDLEYGHFLITAKHVLEDGERTRSLEIFHEQQWKTLAVEPVSVPDKNFDAIALKLPIRISPELFLPYSYEMTVSQEVFFLGFPLGLFTDASVHNNGFPLPFVKKATLSGLGDANGLPIIFLDGIGNPGFSGGPVVSLFRGVQNTSIIGIISANKIQEAPIFYQGKQLQMVHRENTGIIIASGIKPVIDAVASKYS